MKHGHGIFYWPDGTFYDGEWQNDRREGQGTLHFCGGGNYTGGWKNNKKEGYGIYCWSNGTRSVSYTHLDVYKRQEFGLSYETIRKIVR